MKATYKKYILNFKRPSGTSRGVLRTKETWFLILQEGEKIGVGECGILRTLSIDDRPDYEEKIQWVCENIHLPLEDLLAQLVEFPSIQFGVEMALKSFEAQDPFQLFPSAFTEGKKGIKINGLIWMGEEAFMLEQIQQKLEQGFSCIKLKIGAIDFEKEIALLQSIRKKYSALEIELRVDANGAFSTKEALQKLKLLSELDLHSIEQPIKQGQITEMAQLCATTPLPIALDEELIGVFSASDKDKLLASILPQYIILKPSLIGGFKGTQEWIDLAEKHKIGWWVTSALESNIGLNAISQYTFMQDSHMPQGLGTGSLYTNNIESPLQIKGETITYNPKENWDINSIL
ncbi:o-succinylbenzoate synthase [Mesonia phycicola]|uniref:O-succinylbenzoate synthase n=1 Tax=Mesonia phycicola TaxID=579105 RepID=A0A1M6FDW6_9FLAO|nr:o-succinylbenzoate synthase [Mesonia phycicola]SHI95871.1 o-succinylbenzoate synthase [Mesonia phycicola]